MAPDWGDGNLCPISDQDLPPWTDAVIPTSKPPSSISTCAKTHSGLLRARDYLSESCRSDVLRRVAFSLCF